MTFKEWQEKLNELQGKLSRGTIYDIAEVVGVGGTTVTITLGKGGLRAEVGDNTCDIRYLRTLFTPYKEVFEDLLDTLDERVTATVESTEILLQEVVAEIIPDAVIDRLKGNGGEADNTDLLQQLVEKRFKDLKPLFDSYKPDPFQEYRFAFEPLNETPFEIYNRGYQGYVVSVVGCQYDMWGEGKVISSTDIKTCLNFLGNYDTIKQQLETFLKGIATFRSLAFKE